MLCSHCDGSGHVCTYCGQPLYQEEVDRGVNYCEECLEDDDEQEVENEDD